MGVGAPGPCVVWVSTVIRIEQIERYVCDSLGSDVSLCIKKIQHLARFFYPLHEKIIKRNNRQCLARIW